MFQETVPKKEVMCFCAFFSLIVTVFVLTITSGILRACSTEMVLPVEADGLATRRPMMASQTQQLSVGRGTVGHNAAPWSSSVWGQRSTPLLGLLHII